MSRSRTSIVIVGVGGQGSVFVARVLGQAALTSDLDVVASELHGMAQRGGVVESTVIIGKAHGPIVTPGEADLLIALEPLETVRALHWMRRGAAAVVGRVPIVPTSVSLGDVPYPPVGELLAEAGAWLGKMAALDLGALAEAAGERRAIGAVALGATAGLAVLPISADTLRQTTIELAPPRKRDQNAAAFDAGFRAVEDPKSAARRRH